MRPTRTHAKQDHRRLFRAMQHDAKLYPGGIQALARDMGMNGTTLANGLNADHEAPPPSFGVVLEVITQTQGVRTIRSLCELVGCVPTPAAIEERSRGEAVALFLRLMHQIGGVMDKGGDAASDGRFDQAESTQLEALLLDMQHATDALLRALRG